MNIKTTGSDDIFIKGTNKSQSASRMEHPSLRPSPRLPALCVCLSQREWCPWLNPLSPPLPLGSGLWGCLLSVAGLVEGGDRPFGVRPSHENQDGQGARRRTSILEFHQWKQESCTLCWRTCKTDTVTRCSRVSWALQGLLLSNTLKKSCLPALSGKFLFSGF